MLNRAFGSIFAQLKESHDIFVATLKAGAWNEQQGRELVGKIKGIEIAEGIVDKLYKNLVEGRPKETQKELEHGDYT